jgi:hypothetical protein
MENRGFPDLVAPCLILHLSKFLDICHIAEGQHDATVKIKGKVETSNSVNLLFF